MMNVTLLSAMIRITLHVADIMPVIILTGIENQRILLTHLFAVLWICIAL